MPKGRRPVGEAALPTCLRNGFPAVARIPGDALPPDLVRGFGVVGERRRGPGPVDHPNRLFRRGAAEDPGRQTRVRHHEPGFEPGFGGERGGLREDSGVPPARRRNSSSSSSVTPPA
nr:hypothetical protein GCM10017745_41660 [Saccharothrix mutabilis subsp. capreolus]